MRAVLHKTNLSPLSPLSPLPKEAGSDFLLFFSRSLANQIGGSLDFVDVYVGRGRKDGSRGLRVYVLFCYFRVILHYSFYTLYIRTITTCAEVLVFV